MRVTRARSEIKIAEIKIEKKCLRERLRLGWRDTVGKDMKA